MGAPIEVRAARYAKWCEGFKLPMWLQLRRGFNGNMKLPIKFLHEATDFIVDSYNVTAVMRGNMNIVMALLSMNLATRTIIAINAY